MNHYEKIKVKALYARIPLDLWELLKNESTQQQRHMSTIVTEIFRSYQKTKYKKVLKSVDTE